MIYKVLFVVNLLIAAVAGITFFALFRKHGGIKPKKWKESVKWRNIPLGLKGVFFLIPSVFPVYYFLRAVFVLREDVNLEEAFSGLGAILAMFTYFVAGLAFLLFVLGVSWITVASTSVIFRYYQIYKHGERVVKKRKKTIIKKNRKVLKKRDGDDG